MSLRETLRRSRQMSGAELRFRLSQRWRILQEQWRGQHADSTSWLDCWDRGRIAPGKLRAAIEAGDAPQALTALPQYFITRNAPSFYFDPKQKEELRRSFADAFPARVDRLRHEAESICQHRFSIFAYPEIFAGNHLAWQKDWVHGKQAANEYWARVPYLDFSRAGDSKIVWEPNRHQHFVTLSMAFFLTGEERFAQECFVQWDDWLRENPPNRGINWASSLELAFRAWSWIWALHFLQGSALFTGERLAAYFTSLSRHCVFIEQNLSTYFSPNTHLLGEGFLLFVAGVMFPELRGAAGWREMGKTILEEEIERQVRPDGWHAEQSSYYHRYAVDFFQCAAILADRNHCHFPTAYRSKLALMYEVILETQLPNGRQPMLGDADGGRLLPFSERPSPEDSHDQRSALSTGAVYFARPDFRAAAEVFHEDTFWLLGPDARREFDSLAQLAQVRKSRLFADSGWVVMHASSPRDSVLLFDTGPQGLHGCGHGHADALSIVCAAPEQDWLMDPGTYVYTASGEWREAFRGTRAHNTVVVDGVDQAVPVDFFKWREIPRPRLESWLTSPSLDVAVASHDGYLRLPLGVLHRRRVVFCKPHFWLVTDELNGRGQHTAEFLFHFPPGTRLVAQDRGCLAQRAGHDFLLFSTDSSLQGTVVEGDERNRVGWVSLEYGSKVAAPVFQAKRTFHDSLVVTWLLCPNPRVPAYDVEGQWKTVTVRAGDEIHQLHHGAPVSRVARSGVSDAEFFYRCSAASGSRMALFNGCCVLEDGKSILEAEAMQDFLECEWAGEELRVLAKPLRRFRCKAPAANKVFVNGVGRDFTRAGDWIEILPS